MEEQMNNELYLCFDFGMKRIGVAVGQKLTGTATPLPTVSATNGTPNDWGVIANLIAQWKPAALVVGVPLNIDGSKQAITHAAQGFIKQLKKHTGITVFAAEERLTTKAAREKLFDDGGYRALKKKAIDGFAAKLILEEWMDAPNKLS